MDSEERKLVRKLLEDARIKRSTQPKLSVITTYTEEEEDAIVYACYCASKFMTKFGRGRKRNSFVNMEHYQNSKFRPK